MGKAYFVTGTDTNVGKTWATLAMMSYFKKLGKVVIGMKPVASGCFMQDGQLKNEDALSIQQAGSVWLDYDLINPYAYERAVSPHIAGIKNPVEMTELAAKVKELSALADILIVEGAGGWYSPLNANQANSDLAQFLEMPVILVVAIRLGCINHARLTYQAIKQSGLNCAGWIAVCALQNVLGKDETLSTLSSYLDTPLLGILPYRQQPDFDFFSEQFSF